MMTKLTVILGETKVNIVRFRVIILLYPPYNEVERGILEVPWPSMRLSVRRFVCGHNFVWSFSLTALKFIHNICVHMKSACAIFMTMLSFVVELSPLELVNFAELLLNSKVTHNVSGSIQFCMCHTVIDC